MLVLPALTAEQQAAYVQLLSSKSSSPAEAHRCVGCMCALAQQRAAKPRRC